jgi:hypothetical protein
MLFVPRPYKIYKCTVWAECRNFGYYKPGGALSSSSALKGYIRQILVANPERKRPH